MHLKRWITSIAALPLLVLLIGKGGPLLFAVFISIVCVFALWEYFRIVLHDTRSAASIKTESVKIHGRTLSACSFQLAAFIIGPIIIWAAYRNSFESIVGLIALNILLAASLSLPRFTSDSLVSEIVIKQVVSIIYVPLLLSFIVLIRNGAAGVTWIFFLLCVVFAGDIGAFYIGSSLGRHKLCPAVSPAKTVEGSIGGLAANIGVGALFKFFFLPLTPWCTSILLFISIGIAGQIGDLFESELKRVAHIKDSGVVLPGHGGILDRIDALLFAAPVAYFFKEYVLY